MNGTLGHLMTANINEDELKLLTHLHEHATGYGEHAQFLVESLLAVMNMEKEKFRKDISYLKEHGLVGVHAVPFKSQRPVYYEITTVWITGLGEDYMRALEKEPGIARRLTVSVLSELWATGKAAILSTASQLLADYAKNFHH